MKAILNGLPNEFELDTLIEKLIFIDKVEKGLKQLACGNTITHEQVKQKIKHFSNSIQNFPYLVSPFFIRVTNND